MIPLSAMAAKYSPSSRPRKASSNTVCTSVIQPASVPARRGVRSAQRQTAAHATNGVGADQACIRQLVAMQHPPRECDKARAHEAFAETGDRQEDEADARGS